MTSEVDERTHLVPIGRDGWSLWRWIMLRSAGFPARWARALGSDELIAALAREHEAEQALAESRDAALRACRAALEAAPDSLPLKQARNRLVAGKAPLHAAGIDAVDRAIDANRIARERLAEAQHASDTQLAIAVTTTDEVIRQTGRDRLFREALIWQNRGVLHGAIDSLLEQPPGTDNASVRTRQRTVARYLERYTLKNDTIGFFGPSVWGSFDLGRESFEATPGATLVDRRDVSFEPWALDALAAVISEQPETWPIFVPRLRPLCWIEGQILHIPTAAPRQLTPSEAYLLARADGTASARAIVDAATADPTSGLGSADDAYQELVRLGRQRYISWEIEIPAGLEHPERWLRDQLSRIEDATARRTALEALDRLEAARTEIARAAGDPEALDRAIASLEDEFRSLTSLAVKRGHGQVYAGRQLFYEDCRRTTELTAGSRLIETIGPPLSLVLESARWFTYEVARRFRIEIDQIFKTVTRSPGDPNVPLGSLLAAGKDLFRGDQHVVPRFVAEARDELHRRWAEVLALDDHVSENQIQLASDDYRERIKAAFQAPHAGWPRARHHSPDVLIAAASLDHLNRGELWAILGEIHCAANTHLVRSSHYLHPDREAVERAWDLDLPGIWIAPVQATHRSAHPPRSARDLHVELTTERSSKPREQIVAGGDLFVTSTERGLVVRSRTRELEYDIVSFMEHYLSASSMVNFSLLPTRAHTPRIALDRLLISRERWVIPRSELEELLSDGTLAERVRAATRWARARHLPRFVFGKVPNEAKPFYVDFGSPITLDILVRYIREAEQLSVSECVPGDSELWLTDAAGERYTSELRLVAVDPNPWSPAEPSR